MSQGVPSADVGVFDLGAEMRRFAVTSQKFGRAVQRWLEENPGEMPDLECRETYRVYANSMLGIAKYVAQERKDLATLNADELAQLRYATARAVVLELDDVAMQRLLAERGK